MNQHKKVILPENMSPPKNMTSPKKVTAPQNIIPA